MTEDRAPLPCPFCGVTHRLKIEQSPFDKTWTIVCGNIDCKWLGYKVQAAGSTEAEVIERWNRRALPSGGDTPMSRVSICDECWESLCTGCQDEMAKQLTASLAQTGLNYTCPDCGMTVYFNDLMLRVVEAESGNPHEHAAALSAPTREPQ